MDTITPKIPWYKNPLVYAVIIIAIVIIGFIIFSVLYKTPAIPNNSAQFIAQQSALYQNLDYWGPSSGITGNSRSQCGIYTFQGFVDVTGTQVIAVQGDITTNKSVVDACGVTGSCIGPVSAATTGCLDADQIALQLQQHTCTDIGTNGIGCRDYDGTRFPVGAVDTFYSPCGINPCTNTTVGSVAINFIYSGNPLTTYNNARCIYPTFGITGTTGTTGSTGTTGTTLYFAGMQSSLCDLSLPQLWRITRADFINNTFKIDSSGSFAKIQNRQTGLCMVPIGFNGTVGTTGTTGTTGVTNGSGLTLIPCRGNQYPWLLAPELQISGLTTPQQLVWAPKPVPLSTTADIINYINTYKPLSVVIEGGIPILRPFALDIQTQSQYSAQYLDYAIFNLILNNNIPF